MSGYEREDWARKDLGHFVANDDPSPSFVGATAVVEREGRMGIVKRGSHRHKVLLVFANHSPSGITQMHAGVEAYNIHSVGVGTQSGEEVGRRRSGDLARMGYIERVSDRSSLWRTTESGYALLRELA